MANLTKSHLRNPKKAMSPSEQIRVAVAAKANAIIAASGASLLSLPYDVEQIIFENLIDEGDLATKPSISYRKLANGQRHQELDLSFVTVYKRLVPLLKVCKQTRSSCYEFLGESVTLIETKSDRLLYQQKKKYWSKSLLSKIQRLEVVMTRSMRLKHEEDWPGYLNVFINTMISLNHLQLTSTWSAGARPWPRALSGESALYVTHEQQERRCKLRLLSFLISQHPNLDRIRLPAASQSPLVYTSTYTQTLVAEKSAVDQPGDCEFLWESMVKDVSLEVGKQWPKRAVVEHHDEIIDATRIRKLDWTQICHTTDSELTIRPGPSQTRADIVTSEVYDAESKWFQMVDQRAYRDRQAHMRNRWQKSEVDEMVEICRKLKYRKAFAACAAAASSWLEDPVQKQAVLKNLLKRRLTCAGEEKPSMQRNSRLCERLLMMV